MSTKLERQKKTLRDLENAIKRAERRHDPLGDDSCEFLVCSILTVMAISIFVGGLIIGHSYTPIDVSEHTYKRGYINGQVEVLCTMVQGNTEQHCHNIWYTPNSI